MKNTFCLLLFVTALHFAQQMHAQLVWQRLDTLGGIKRGNYIFSSSKGVYVISDQSSPGNPGSSGGKTNVLHFSNAGNLDWQKKVNLGTPAFEQYGFLTNPKTDLEQNLVFRKIKVLNDNAAGYWLEKFWQDGTHKEVPTSRWSGELAIDPKTNDLYCPGRSNGSPTSLQSFTEDLVPIGIKPLAADGRFNILNSGDYYLMGYGKIMANGDYLICNQKTTAGGLLLWESIYKFDPPVTPLDYINVSTTAVDPMGNIYLLIRIARDDSPEAYILTKTSPEGIPLWRRKITAAEINPSTNTIYSEPKLLADANGNSYLCGTIGNATGLYDAFVCKFNATGNISWSKKLSYNNSPSSARSALYDAYLQEGALFITGWYGWAEENNGNWTTLTDLMALKISTSNGNSDWKASYRMSTNQAPGVTWIGYGIVAKGPDSIYVTGMKLQGDFSQVLTVCFKDNQSVNGNLIGWNSFNLETTTATWEALVQGLTLELFPNPATESLQIKLPEGILGVKVRIYDSAGKLVQANNDKLEDRMDIRLLPAGMYWMEVQTLQGLVSGKFVKE